MEPSKGSPPKTSGQPAIRSDPGTERNCTMKKTTNNITAHFNGFDLDEAVMTEYTETGSFLDLDGIRIFEEPNIGHHRVKLSDWTEEAESWTYPEGVKPEDAKPEEVRHMPAHIRLELQDVETGAYYLKRVYAQSLQSFFKNLLKQAGGKLSGKSARQMLNHYRTTGDAIEMWAAKMDDRDAVAIYFFDVFDWRERKAAAVKLAGTVIK